LGSWVGDLVQGAELNREDAQMPSVRADRPVDAGGRPPLDIEAEVRVAWGVGSEDFVCFDCIRIAKIIWILHKKKRGSSGGAGRPPCERCPPPPPPP